MTTHRYHPDPDRGDLQDSFLWDDCDRCGEHSADPRSLDPRNLRRLVESLAMNHFVSPPTENELLARANLHRALQLVERAATAVQSREVTWQALVTGSYAPVIALRRLPADR